MSSSSEEDDDGELSVFDDIFGTIGAGGKMGAGGNLMTECMGFLHSLVVSMGDL